MNAYSQTVESILSGIHQLSSAIIACIDLDITPGLTGRQGIISVSYDDGRQRRLTAQTMVDSIEAAENLLRDRDRVAGLINTGIGAMPRSYRPSMPAWIADSAEAARHTSMRRRVSRIASNAAAPF